VEEKLRQKKKQSSSSALNVEQLPSGDAKSADSLAATTSALHAVSQVPDSLIIIITYYMSLTARGITKPQKTL